MIKHIKSKISTILALSDDELKRMFDMPAVEVRTSLEYRKKQGEVYIGSSGCEGFDPVTGCPGHPSETDSITKQ